MDSMTSRVRWSDEPVPVVDDADEASLGRSEMVSSPSWGVDEDVNACCRRTGFGCFTLGGPILGLVKMSSEVESSPDLVMW